MEAIIITYALKVSVALLLFYGLYLICMRKDTFLKIRRFCFLFAIIFSLLYPFFSIELTRSESPATPLEMPAYWISQIEAITVYDNHAPMEAINYQQVVFLIVFAVSVYLLLRFLTQLMSVARIRSKGQCRQFDDQNIILLDSKEKVSPFSFFNWIFITKETVTEEKFFETIAHEKVHVKQWHSVDVLLSELLCIFFWWNPVAWLLKKEIKANLEYLADQGVLDTGFDSKTYQYILLKLATENTGISIINNFNVSQLKKRITMMNKKKSHIVFSAKYLLIIPLGVALIIGNAVQATTNLSDVPAEVMNMISPSPASDDVQSSNKEDLFVETEKVVSDNSDKPYTTVEKMPQFPDGQSALMKYIASNLKYPEVAIKDKIEGRVVLRYVIKKTGEVSDIEIIRGLSPETDAEAIRVVKAMPKWIPGERNGEAVDVYFTLPIVYKLQKDADNKSTSQVAPPPPPKIKASEEEDKPLAIVKEMPQYPGGIPAMQKHLAMNIKYPSDAMKDKIEGRVVVRFIVKSTGEIADVEPVRSLNPSLDAEAVRVVKSMPKWEPGKQDGKAVDVYYTLPIVFKLQSSKTEIPPSEDKNEISVVGYGQ